MSWRYVALFAVIVGGLSVGNILFKIGMTPAETSPYTGTIRGLAMAGGMILMIIQQFTVWYTMRTLPASVVIPITGLNFAVLPVLEFWWLGEPMRADRWGGIILIMLGVAVVAHSQASH